MNSYDKDWVEGNSMNLSSEINVKNEIITVNGRDYYIVDNMGNIPISDSFGNNKLARNHGSGEKRLYLGNYGNSPSAKRTSEFFDFSQWGEQLEQNYQLIGQEKMCFFSKGDFIKYLNDSKIEYIHQEQKYRENLYLENKWEKSMKRLMDLSDDNLFFSIRNISDLKTKELNRMYIKSLINPSVSNRTYELAWDLFVDIVLPLVTYISIIKIKPIQQGNLKNKVYFYFKPILDFNFRMSKHPKFNKGLIKKIEEQSELNVEQKKNLKNARKGQGKFKKNVHEYMPQCPFTMVSDERLLVASHIKPWADCVKENKYNEAIDKLNGISLTPSYDRLFDRGYISFTNEGELLCGSVISNYSLSRLNIDKSSTKKMKIIPEGREEYLEYHRKVLFDK